MAYIIPLYITNAMPILLHGKKPLDFGLKFKGNRILGKGKSILGTLSAFLGGVVSSLILIYFFPKILVIIPNYFLLAMILSIGAILGDLVESFFKRRFNLKSGAQLLFWDQLDFIIGGLLISLLVRVPEIEIIIILLLITVFIHLFSNNIAYKIGLKKVPW